MSNKSFRIGQDEVTVPGFGAMGFSFAYGKELNYEQAEPLLLKAVELGCTFWDTASVYGFGVNERILGDFIRKHGLRHRIFLASKCGFDFESSTPSVTNSPDHIRRYIQGTTERLGFEPDLYYLPCDLMGSSHCVDVQFNGTHVQRTGFADERTYITYFDDFGVDYKIIAFDDKPVQGDVWFRVRWDVFDKRWGMFGGPRRWEFKSVQASTDRMAAFDAGYNIDRSNKIIGGKVNKGASCGQGSLVMGMVSFIMGMTLGLFGPRCLRRHAAIVRYTTLSDVGAALYVKAEPNASDDKEIETEEEEDFDLFDKDILISTQGEEHWGQEGEEQEERDGEEDGDEGGAEGEVKDEADDE
ncbi:Aldo-keto reductase-like protein 4 [Elsinoe fawcettii]|nr:Aldo-keto reductase-like protein 4 [Elsinoe fawcettii]